MPLVSCGKRDLTDENAILQAKLTGAWILEHTPFVSNCQSRITVDSAGNYSEHGQIVGRSNIGSIFESGGSYQIKNGWLIDTVTNNNVLANKEQLPITVSNQIVRLTENELILNFGQITNETTQVIFRKEVK